MQDRYRKRERVGRSDDRLRRQIATEAARRLRPRLDPDSGRTLADLTPLEIAAAKREAVAVLGQRVRPSDLPTDSEVREQALALARAPGTDLHLEAVPPEPPAGRLADHLDRFALFRMRLEPLQDVKLNPRTHPEGDALYHSLQLFELARAARPYDEEFLLAALLHEIGRGIDPSSPVESALLTQSGSISERTAFLIEHLRTLLPRPGETLVVSRPGAELRAAPHADDLLLLAELDLQARQRGATVPTVEEALDYIRTLDIDPN